MAFDFGGQVAVSVLFKTRLPVTHADTNVDPCELLQTQSVLNTEFRDTFVCPQCSHPAALWLHPFRVGIR